MKKIFFLLVLLFSIKVTSAQESGANNYQINQNDGITVFGSNNEFSNSKIIGTFNNFPKVIYTYNKETQSSSNSDSVTNKTRSERDFFIYTGVGIADIVYLGIGKNIFKEYSLAIKTDIFPLRGSGEGIRIATGIGIKFSKLFYNNLLPKSFFPIDNISIEYSYGLTYGSNSTDKNIGKYQFNFGSDKINQSGINFCWAIGIAIITEKNMNALVLPNFRIGLIYNFE